MSDIEECRDNEEYPDEGPLDLRVPSAKKRRIEGETEPPVEEAPDADIRPTSICDLPEECLRIIFLWALPHCRMACRGVSKHWRDVIDDCWRSVDKLQMLGSADLKKHKLSGSFDSIRLESPMQSVLDGLLSHPHAESAFSTIPTDLPTKYLSVSGRRCFPPCEATTYHRRLLNFSYRLTKLTTHFVDEDLLQLIGQTTSLRELTVVWNAYSDLEPSILLPILNLKNLRNLSIVSAMSLHKGLYVQLQIPLHTDFVRLLAMELVNLECLSLGASHHLTDMSVLTDPTFMGLAELKKLRDLRIHGCLHLTGRFLRYLTQVEVVSLTGCGIHDAGAISLIRAAPNLRELYLGGTYITNATVQAAIREMVMRKNDIPLILDVNCTSVTIKDISNAPPLLDILI